MKSPERKRKASGLVERAPTSYDTQQRLEAIAAIHQGNSAQNQRERLVVALDEFGALTTIEARKHLDILSPAPRVMELRRNGKRIKTHWVKQATDCGRLHRVGLYVLEVRQ